MPPLEQLVEPESSADWTGGPSTTPEHTGATEHASTVFSAEALEQERVAQAGSGLTVTAILTLLGSVALQFASRKPPTHYVLTAAMLGLALLAAVQRVRFRQGQVKTESWGLASVGIASAMVTVAATAHVGVLTPIPMILVTLVYYFGLLDHRLQAVIVYITAAAGLLLIAVLSLTGILQLTESLVALDRQNIRALLILTTLGEIVLAMTFVLARRSRQHTLRAMEQLESARQKIGQRQALLDEAQEDLKRALDAAKIGRFTGQRVGPYVAGEVLGRGGMGEVYRGMQHETHQAVALKVLHPHVQEDTDQLERFVREAEISSGLRSPHIVEVFDSGRAEDGSMYLTMELLSGYDLGQILRQQRRLRLRDVVTLVEQVASALDVAQKAGIVHRDLKPQNLFRAATRPEDTSPSGSADALWKVLDFGISKAAGVQATLTHNAVVGTPGYMSPEQARGDAVDHRSDVFSLGVIAYRVVTGRPAFHASDPVAMLYKVMKVMPVRPSEIVRVPRNVDLVLALAMAKNPKQRFSSARKFANALRAASQEGLDDDLRESAYDVLKHHPWAAERIEVD